MPKTKTKKNSSVDRKKNAASVLYRVSYTSVLYDGSEKRGVTKVTYKTKKEAQKYADQLNAPSYLSCKNARVRKA